MKKLLVLTDFSANAFHAEAAALTLAEKMGADVVLYHTLPYIPLIPSDSGGPYVAEVASVLFEDSKDTLMQEADRLREVSVMTPGSAVNVETTNGEGSLSDVIAELTRPSEVVMVIMGGRAGGALEHLLSGSDTAAVIRKSIKPVLVVPMKSQIAFSKVVFATDFGTADLPAVTFLLELSGSVGFDVNIVHVRQPGEVVTEIGPEIAFRKFLDHRRLSFTSVFSEDIHRGLQAYCQEKGAEILAMTHARHSFVARVFGHSESLTAIADQNLAVLVFPPDFH